MILIVALGNDLRIQIATTPTLLPQKRDVDHAFAIGFEFLDEQGNSATGKMILHERSSLPADNTYDDPLTFSGMVSLGDKPAKFFTGTCTEHQCVLTVPHNPGISTGITREKFVRNIKEYCSQNNIPVDKQGNLKNGGLAEMIAMVSNLDAKKEGGFATGNDMPIRVYYVMYDGYIPIIYDAPGKKDVMLMKYVDEDHVVVCDPSFPPRYV